MGFFENFIARINRGRAVSVNSYAIKLELALLPF